MMKFLVLCFVASFGLIVSQSGSAANLAFKGDILLPFDAANMSLEVGNGGHQYENYSRNYPFNVIGANSGVCQGVATTNAALYLNATFQPDESLLNSEDLMDRMEVATGLYSNGCTERVVIPGIANVKDLTRIIKDLGDSNLEKLYDLILSKNLTVAIKDIVPLLPEFLRFKSARSIDAKLRTLESLNSIHETLMQGRPALMLYYSHVVMVYGFANYEDGTRLRIADPNYPETPEHNFNVNWRENETFAIWDITPQHIGQRALICQDIVDSRPEFFKGGERRRRMLQNSNIYPF